MKKARYITTTLPYVNSDPHIGFAYEVVAADAFARAWRVAGHEVFFNTGTDEHGQKIAQKADTKGQDRQAYVDHYASEFKKLGAALNLSFDNFIRTTDAVHKEAAQEMWRRCLASGDIYKKKYSGLYCVGCESFKTEADLVDGKCPDHGTVPELIEEENYFFKASRYRDYLVNEYLAKPGVILPEWRRLEAIAFAEGLEDFSISREKHRLNWGVPVPDDETQVMYVWFDALTNYISTLGWPTEAGNFTKYWQDGEVVQLGGKDQVRFQSIMWQAMLKSAGVKATDCVVYHGFITIDGQKMSKTIGNTISPYELIARYGIDATRYLLLRHVHPFDDADASWAKFDEWYTANLVNGLGNLTARILKMAESYGVTEATLTAPIDASLGDFNFQKYLDTVFARVGALDAYIQKEEPFKKIKIDEVAAKNDVAYLLGELKVIASALAPCLPDTAKIILDAVNEVKKPENLFPRLI